MKLITPYRTALALLVLFFVGHTAGGMFSHESMGPAADAVWESMKAVHFNFNGSDCTYYGFHQGFGLTVSVFQLFSILVIWQLSRTTPHKALRPIAWGLCATFVGVAALSWRYFFAGPGVFASLIALLLGVEAWRKYR